MREAQVIAEVQEAFQTTSARLRWHRRVRVGFVASAEEAPQSAGWLPGHVVRGRLRHRHRLAVGSCSAAQAKEGP